jgi:uncharacterized protein (TIGR03000 family)
MVAGLAAFAAAPAFAKSPRAAGAAPMAATSSSQSQSAARSPTSAQPSERPHEYPRLPVPGSPLHPWIPPTAAHPYPPGYVLGPFAPLAFTNADPNAPADQGVIYVFLPVPKAEVYINGQKMLGTGSSRKYQTGVLPLSHEYRYAVTVRYQKGGRTVDEFRAVDLGAGEYGIADFTRPHMSDPLERASVRLSPGPIDVNQVARK